MLSEIVWYVKDISNDALDFGLCTGIMPKNNKGNKS